MKAAIIIGDHPIRLNLMEQFKAKGCRVDVFRSFDEVGEVIDYGEVCILPDQRESDEDTLQRLENLAKVFPAPDPSAPKPVCHLLLHNRSSLWLLQTFDLLREIPAKFELNAFTLVDFWAKNVICQPNSNQATYPHLDRERIDVQSNKTVHLVIQGFSEMGESLAYHAALTCHFPNYERDHSLRTRITVIDENIMKRRDAFIQRYKYLFRHSYYRTIDVKSRSMTQFHEPLYNSSRENFVDVEWEFVNGSLDYAVVQRKLALWANDPNQLLTIALCETPCQNNFDHAFIFPDEVYRNNIPVLVYVKQAVFLEKIRETPNYRNLFPFGMDNCGYDISLPLLKMAKMLNYCYSCSFGQKGIPTHLPPEEVEREWNKIESVPMRYSNLYHVMTVAAKMRSLGHPDNDWNRLYALTKEEIGQISAVEHNRWSVERLLLGFRPPTDEERREIADNIKAFILAKKTGSAIPEVDMKAEYKRKKIHYDLCAYRELREDKTGNNVRVYDDDLNACIPLIAQTFNESRS
jgi:hypothetical protein